MALGDGDGDGPCAARAGTHLGQIQGLRDAYSHSGTRGGREAERGHLGCAGRRGRGWGAVATSPSPRRPTRHPPGAPTREQPALPSVPTRGPAGSVHCSPHAPLAAARKEPPSPAHRGKVQNWPRPLTHHLPHRESLSCPRPRRCAPQGVGSAPAGQTHSGEGPGAPDLSLPLGPSGMALGVPARDAALTAQRLPPPPRPWHPRPMDAGAREPRAARAWARTSRASKGSGSARARTGPHGMRGPHGGGGACQGSTPQVRDLPTVSPPPSPEEALSSEH